MKSKEYIYIGIILALVIIFAVYALYPKGEKPPGQYDEFAKCLTEKGAVMYGAYWCPHCTDQKEMFGGSFKYVNYVECDPRGSNAKPELCKQAGITGYPTWIISGRHYSGTQKFQTLASATGCSL